MGEHNVTVLKLAVKNIPYYFEYIYFVLYLCVVFYMKKHTSILSFGNCMTK